ncbi:MAG: PBP1A family penicillin-binding protein [Pseudomonadota bacterium]
MPPYRRDRSQLANRKNKSAKKKNTKDLKALVRTAWRITKVLIVLIIIGSVALAYHMRKIDRLIETKFDKPRKWDLPSRVYSDAEYLYPGLNIKVRKIIAKLDRLGYRNTGEKIVGPGDYSINENRLELYLHNFAYPNEDFRGFPVKLELDSGLIKNITRTDEDKPIELIRLEPEEVASIYTDKMESRTLVTLKEVPEHLVQSIILIEDERFFEHGGVDPMGILRAMLVNLKSMRIVQGGSTLTQQLVKNFFLYPKRSFIRKLNEALIASRIEKHHTKSEILEAYLNEIYLGQRGTTSVSGVEEASRLYFGKSASQLTTGECALLAGMIKSPNLYNPITHPKKAKERRDFVLKRMLEQGFFTKEQYEKALAEKIVTPKVKTRIFIAPYFIDFVKRQLADLYPPEVLQTEGLRIFTTLDMFMQLAAERALEEELINIEKDNAHVLPKDHEEPLEACLVAVQPSTGYVRALVGGRDYSRSQFDRCTQALRQPGSTFKPFVYLTALDPRRSKKMFTPATLLEDTSFEVKSGGKMWRPRNYDKKEHGYVTLREALEKSYNIATAKVAIEAGLDNVVETAREAGISSELIAVPSVALGAFEVNPMEMASAYTIFPNAGIRAEPISIINVMTKDGQVLEKKSIRMKREFDAAPVFLTTNIMKGVMDNGTGAGARARGFTAIAAGKTGTTSDYKDAWFVGFTPELLALSWVGYDDNATMNMSGSRAALPIWTTFMKDVAPNGHGDFAGPPGIILIRVDPITGGLVNTTCPSGRYEAFIEGNEPQRTCDEIRSDMPTQDLTSYTF